MDEPRQSEMPLGDVIDSAARRIATAFILGGAAIALAIYSRADPPRFEAFETETGIVRVDTRGGTVLHCVENGCYTVVRRGQALLDREERQKARAKAFGEEPPPAQRAVQPPQPQKALPAPTAPEPAPANAQ